VHITVPEKIETLYLDFETTSGDPQIAALNPWHNCGVLGYAWTYDDCPDAQYIPIAHKYGENFDRKWAFEALRLLLGRAETWCNHNVKFDAHVFINNVARLPQDLQLRCTVVGAKLLNSDMQYSGGYGLDNLSLRWLQKDIGPLEQAFAPYLHKNKDYANIPADIMEPYAIADVLTARELDKHIAKHMAERVCDVYATEQKLTRVLVDIEQRGLCVDEKELRLAEFKARARMGILEQRAHETTGVAMRLHTNADCFDVLCTKYGLPVLGWTEAGEPSFDKFAIVRYQNLVAQTYPGPTKLLGLINDIAEFRKLSTSLTHFVEPYRALNVNGVLHSSYNQLVRTGRMSSREPNSQQLDKATKYLIHPRAGFGFLSIDLSQIEFRLIVHYIENAEAIRAYNENPDTDFHSLMAQTCGVSRRAAKTLNFAIGFGAGKAKTLAMLAANPDVIARGGNVQEQAENVFNAYHAGLEELKPTSYRASAAVRKRGYVENLFGRRRHLPIEYAHIAFNSAVQSSAADLLKSRTVAIAEEIAASGLDIHIVASVHDETLFEVPLDLLERPETTRALVRLVETVPGGVAFSVPIRSSAGISGESWGAASADDNVKMVEHGPEDILQNLENISFRVLTHAE
jgi:DNA polymerase-1